MTTQLVPDGPALLPPSQGSGGRMVKIVALVAIGLVVCCGIAGTCLFAFTLVQPLIMGTPTVIP
jgi:hypothetical protein